MMSLSRRALFVLLAAVLALHGPSAHAQSDDQTLTVFAAASLTDAFEALGTAFEAAHPGTEVVFNFSGSSTLVAQLAEGAPADVFASANEQQMRAAQEAGRIAEPVRVFARNRLVVALPADNPAGIASLDDLARPGVLLVVAASEVPVRAYTDQMLELMAADPAYGEEYRVAFMANVVSEEATVRHVAAKVALGEADAGIIYRSDITPDIAAQVRTIPIPDAYNTLATYPIAITDDTPYPELAQAFITFVLSGEGQAILTEWGFIPALSLASEAAIRLTLDGALHIEGLAAGPLALRAADLRADFNPQTAEVSYEGGTTTYTGAALWDVLGGSQAGAGVDYYIAATGASGHQVVLSWGEINPAYGGTTVLLAYDADGAPPSGTTGLALVVPGDPHDGRTMHDLVHLSVRQAPAVQSE